MSDPAPWSIAIFAARESLAELMLTLNSTLSAISRSATVDLVINGNPSLAQDCAAQLRQGTGLAENSLARVRVWFIEMGDKAHAWNQYLEVIWPGTEIAFFMDGYVRPDGDAFERLEAGLQTSPLALGATGIPRMGRTAGKLREAMLRQGGIHGNLYCLRRDTVRRIVDSGFRLPRGIYRTDSALGAALKFNLDPAANEWNPARIRVQPDASWATPVRHWWSLSDLKSQFKRTLRQMQGDLENRAVRQHFAVERRAVDTLAPTAAELVCNWVARHPDEAKKMARRSFFYRSTLNKLRQPKDWQAAQIPPRLLYGSGE